MSIEINKFADFSYQLISKDASQPPVFFAEVTVVDSHSRHGDITSRTGF